jgi:hypothetical protein
LLENARIQFQQELLMDCFSFQSLQNRLNYLVRLVSANARVIQVLGVPDISQREEMARKDIFSVSEKFKQQLNAFFGRQSLPDSDPQILERVSKASAWFQDKFFIAFDDIVQKMVVETDNKELGKKINNALENLKQEIRIKQAGIQSCSNGFSPILYQHAIANAEIDALPVKKTSKVKKSQTPVYTQSDIDHPELFQTLKEWRAQRAKEQELAHFKILHQSVLVQLAVCLPDNETDLEQIKGMGPKTMEKYGEDLLEIVNAYRKEKGIKTVILPVLKEVEPEKKPPPAKKEKGVDTKQVSFDLFNKGLSVAQIAKERSLVENTIIGHLCVFVEKGELDINRLLSSEKQNTMDKAFARKIPRAWSAVKAIKTELGSDFSYGDIKLMIAHKTHQMKKN